MMCVGMKLGTWCSQSGSPFLNLILQNWKTLARYFRIYREAPLVCQWSERVWGPRLGSWGDQPTQACYFTTSSGPCFFRLASPWALSMVSKIAESEWELAPGSGLGEMINLYWKTPVPDSPFVSWTPEGHGRRQATLIFTQISGTSQ